MISAENFVRKAGLFVCLLILGAGLLPGIAVATEGGQSVYVPGAYGNFGMGALPGPGFYFGDFAYWYTGSSTQTVRNGRLQLNASETVYANTFEFTGVSSSTIFGGRYWGGLYIPVAVASLNAGATLNVLGQTVARTVSGSQFGVGDLYAIPFGLAWDTGNVHISFYEGVNLPTGEYNVNNFVNIGLNYWASDTNIAASYLNPKTGFTFGANFGYLINAINPATQYQSGQVFHVDAMIGQYFTQTFGVGIVGYAFQQTTGDSGSGALLGPFEGRAYGIGPAVQGIIMAGKTPLVLEAQWIHQFDVVNQFQGDYVQFTVAFKL